MNHSFKITILGAGNGGQAMSGHFAMLGHRVTLYNRTLSKLVSIQQKKRILLFDAICGEGYLYRVTSDLVDAVKDAELIMVTTTADAHRELAEKLGTYLKNGQIIVLNPGRTLGAIDFAITLRKFSKNRVYVAEAQSLLYACRAELPGQVRVIGVKEKVLLGAWPKIDTDFVLKKLNSIYPCFIKAESVLETSLENIGAILHPPVILFNAAVIERGQSFYFYNDITPSISHVIEQIDKERLLIGEGFGLKLKSVSDWVSFAYCNIKGNNLCDKMRSNPAYYKILSPTKLRSRLLLEDIPTGILPFLELGKIAGVKTPLMNALFHLSESLLKLNFSEKGRTLKNLGLENIDKELFMKIL